MTQGPKAILDMRIFYQPTCCCVVNGALSNNTCHLLHRSKQTGFLLQPWKTSPVCPLVKGNHSGIVAMALESLMWKLRSLGASLSSGLDSAQPHLPSSSCARAVQIHLLLQKPAPWELGGSSVAVFLRWNLSAYKLSCLCSVNWDWFFSMIL